MPRIVFICTANICRSPVAAALFGEWLSKNKVPGDWRVESAGAWTQAGLPASTYTRELLAERGLDLSEHRSRLLDAQMVESADLMLCMTQSHREGILADFPTAAGRLFLLSAMAGPAYDIDDPYGGPRAGYVEMIQEIEHLIEVGGPRILSLASHLSKSSSRAGANEK